MIPCGAVGRQGHFIFSVAVAAVVCLQELQDYSSLVLLSEVLAGTLLRVPRLWRTRTSLLRQSYLWRTRTSCCAIVVLC